MIYYQNAGYTVSGPAILDALRCRAIVATTFADYRQLLCKTELGVLCSRR